MKIQRIVAGLVFLTIFSLVSSLSFAQITSGGKIGSVKYFNGSKDSIYVFCGQKGELNASLIANSPTNESSNFEWLKYNELSRSFELSVNDQAGKTKSIISGLQDGCYRVNIIGISGRKSMYTAWVFNNYIETTAEITESDCNSFKLKGTLISPNTFTYFDLMNGQPIILNKDIRYKWLEGNNVVSNVSISRMSHPPVEDTNYTFQVSDKFGCVSKSDVRYISIVTKASFSYVLEDQKKSHLSKKEAPLTVTFTNTSKNGDSGKYEWFIFKGLGDIENESGANKGIVKDSILVKIYNDNPIYVFERPGLYKVKLVSQKKSEFTTCFDTVYIDDYIEVDSSFIEAPNVITPNGDDANDKFVVRFFSMKSVKISIFNRWGKVLHVWESSNVQGFGPTVESTPQAVWDAKVGGKLATPGVYYYVAEGIGRDDMRHRTSGFFHLFRGK